MPRVTCPRCERDVAAAPAARRPGIGHIYRHDEPQMHREYFGSLVSCPGSLALVELPHADHQLELLVIELEGLDGLTLMVAEDVEDVELEAALF